MPVVVVVEAISEVTAGREAPGRFLFSATVELFEQYGFTRGRQVGKHAWIVEPGGRAGQGTTGEMGGKYWPMTETAKIIERAERAVVKWKLDHPLPADLYPAFAAVGVV